VPNVTQEVAALSKPELTDAKLQSLHQHHALNSRPESVRDPAFTAGDPFFDARDLVQVKYEMLRSVRQEGRPASQAAQDFGFSRPSFYQARALFEEGGLPALLPQRPGPKRAHKLSEEVVDFLESALAEEAALNSSLLAELLLRERGLTVHPRSIERALERRSKKGPGRRP
jgi:transposase